MIGNVYQGMHNNGLDINRNVGKNIMLVKNLKRQIVELQHRSLQFLLKMGSLGQTVSEPKKFNTKLTDYSTTHADNTGPYAENLEVDVLVVGAGFGMWSSIQGLDYQLTK